jgi:hypothetical protein
MSEEKGTPRAYLLRSIGGAAVIPRRVVRMMSLEFEEDRT